MADWWLRRLPEDGADVDGPFPDCDVSQKLDFIAVTPDVPLSTEKARAALPAQYSRQDLVQKSAARGAADCFVFFGGRADAGTFQRSRASALSQPSGSGNCACLEYRHDGLAGIFMSGAGSSVMAIAKHSAGEIGEALVKEFRREGVKASARVLKADNRGAHVVAAQ